MQGESPWGGNRIAPVAAHGFHRAAALYEVGRPEPPPAALEELGRRILPEKGSWVADVGAGTGKLTRHLTDIFPRVLAVEPVRGMREEFLRQLPRCPLLAGRAEALPVRTGSLQAIVASQAFHWFVAERAIPEFARALGPSGQVALLWSHRDLADPHQQRISGILDSYARRFPGTPRATEDAWKRAWERTDLFQSLERSETRFTQVLDLASAEARFASVSYISALPPAEQEEARTRIRGVLEDQIRAAPTGRVEIAYRCELYLTRKVQ